jgi:release factor glutamine methyltransferase
VTAGIVTVEIVARLRAAGCVFAEEEAALLIGERRDDLEAMISRRVAGEPLEYILGWAGFHGIRVFVEPGVFVPRHRTELLVDEALRLARPDAVVVDLCCGSGAIGAAMLAVRPELDVWAADIDPAAVHSARRNLPADRVFEGDLFDALPVGLRGRIDVLVVNTPYVPTAEIALMPPEARDHEALVTLDGGRDGLDLQRRVAAAAPLWLARGGSLLVETSDAQAPVTVSIFEAAGLHARIVEDDDATVVVGQR